MVTCLIPFEEYRNKFESAKMERTDGILEITLQTAGKSLAWTHTAHNELGMMFKCVASDRSNRIVILTGTGDEFSGPRSGWDKRVRANRPTSEEWDEVIYHGRQLEMNLLDIEVPVIAALNGPPYRHAELPLLCDIVIASDDVIFEDTGHFHHGNLVPGDGMHLVLSLLLGHNRARYLQLMGTSISAGEAKDMGLVAEVLPKGDVMPRAREIAATLAKKQDLLLRYTRLVFTHRLKKMMLEDLGYGLALEGLAISGSTSQYPARSGN
jgi:enoyl-CoA hydratase/carnithine racemase